MSIFGKHKRRPFGSNAGNRSIVVQKRAIHSARRSIGAVSPQSLLHCKHKKSLIGLEKSRQRPSSQADKENDPRAGVRHDSKTPKTANLAFSAVGHAERSVSVENHATGAKKALKRRDHHASIRPDPSPKKRPDPSAVGANLPEDRPINRSSDYIRSNRNLNGPKGANKSVSSSLRRVFNPDKTKCYDPKDNNAVNARNASRHVPIPQDRSETSDMDTECSSPERKTLQSASGRSASSSRLNKSEVGQLSRASSYSETHHISAKLPNKQKINHSSTHRPGLSSTKLVDDVEPADSFQYTPNNVSDQMLDRARSAPADNKPVLDAMLKSCAGVRSRSSESNHKKESGEPLVGSTVGGSSLQRSNSVDASEVTMLDYFGPSHASIRRSRSNSFPPNGSDTLQTKTITSITNDSSCHQNNHYTKASESPLIQQEYTHQPFVHLPAGWKVRMSRSKKKPYYVHPDFGSTWYYPGLIPPPSAAFSKEFGNCQAMNSSLLRHGHQESTMYKKSAEESVGIYSTKACERRNESSSSRFGGTSYAGTEKKELEEQLNHQKEVSSNDAVVELSVHRNSAQKSYNSSHSAVESGYVSQDFGSNEDNAVASDEDHESQHKEDTSEKNDYSEEHSSDDASRRYQEDEPIEFEQTTAMEEFVDTHGAKSVEASEIDPSSPGEVDVQKEINSMTSDHVDVDALLRNGARKSGSLLPTIRETHFESDQSSGSISTKSKPHDKFPSQKTSICKIGLLENASFASDNIDKSAIGDAQNAVDDGDMYVSDGYDQNQSPVFDGNVSSSDESGDEQHVAMEKSTRKSNYVSRKLDWQLEKENNSSNPHCKRKLFPPGPLCSLQFLDLIGDGSMDTPLWRNCKRKRSTLTSIKRSQRNSY